MHARPSSLGLLVVVPLLAIGVLVTGCDSRSAAKAPVRDRLAAGDSEAIQELANKGEAALPQLIQFLQDPDTTVVIQAVGLIERLGPKAAPAVPALLQVLKNPAARSNATYALVALRKQAIPELAQAIKSSDPVLRAAALEVMSKGLGKDAKEAVPALTAVVQSGDAKSKVHAAMALASIGSAAESAIPALQQAAATLEGNDLKQVNACIKRIEDAKKPGMYTDSR